MFNPVGSDGLRPGTFKDRRSGKVIITALSCTAYSRAAMKYRQPPEEGDVEYGDCPNCNAELELLHGLLPHHKWGHAGNTCPGSFQTPVV